MLLGFRPQEQITICGHAKPQSHRSQYYHVFLVFQAKPKKISKDLKMFLGLFQGRLSLDTPLPAKNGVRGGEFPGLDPTGGW